MVVLVLNAMLVFHGCVHVKQRRCKHSAQENPTEYCYASSSHETGYYLTHIPESTTTNPLEP